MERQKDEFMGVASHELKTPVTSIKAYTELLREQFEEANDDDNAKLMQKLDVQVDRLAELIHDLLDTTRISDGQLPLQREQFDLNNLISECVEDLQHTSQKHRIIFESGDIKPVAADRDRIRQVLTNLISNAIKYSPEGCEVTITSSHAKNGIKVSVRDKGMGIPEEMQQKIFERFSRVDQIHPSSGMGLGLYIAAGIIRRHGGNISVKSEPGRGSIFSFILPCSDEVKNTKDEGNADPPLSPRADR